MTRFHLFAVCLSLMLVSCQTLHKSSVHQNQVALHSKVILLKNLPLEKVKDTGRFLMEHEVGLHPISVGNPTQKNQNSAASTHDKITHITIFMHGYESGGYEWIYPIHHVMTHKKQNHLLYFYRWSWLQCPQEAATQLMKHLTLLLHQYPHSQINMIAHSYGGVVLTHSLSMYQAKNKLFAHSIAAPLAGHPKLMQRCPTSLISPFPSTAQLHQWRTQHQLDSAFKSLEKDPQNIKLSGKVTRLPAQYKQYRLGHNRSISWVIEQINFAVK